MKLKEYIQEESQDDTSYTVLLLSNFSLLIIALALDWTIYQVILSFIMQNIVIGFFSATRILNTGKNILEYKTFSANALTKIKILGSAILLTIFFVLHYGVLNWLYLVFIITKIDKLSWALFLIPVAIFIIPHLISYREKQRSIGEEYSLRRVEKYMVLPYLRIIPMHLVMFIAAMFKDSVLLLIIAVVLKTAADLIMHSIGRRVTKIKA